MRPRLKNLGEKGRLRLYFAVFFLLAAIPVSLLLARSLSNLEDEAYNFHRRTAQGLATSLNQQIEQTLRREEERSYAQYRYVHVPERPVPQQEGLNLSPLAAFPVESEIPGALGYFQIDPDGSFHTPLLPSPDVNLDVPQRQERVRVQRRLAEIVSKGSFLRTASTAEPGAGQRKKAEKSASREARLRANLSQELDLAKHGRYAKLGELGRDLKGASPQSARESETEPRREQSSPRQAMVFDSKLKAEEAAKESFEDSGRPQPQRRTDRLLSSLDEPEEDRFEAEIDPFRSQLVDNAWLVLYRKVWWSDRRYVQGIVASLPEFVERWIRPALVNSALPGSADLRLFYGGEPVSLTASPGRPSERKPLLLYDWTLPGAMSEFDLAITVDQLPPGPGAQFVYALAAVLSLVLIAGFWGAYRITATQMELSQKKSDFVSAVSHELKTPLTSIRMYGEMLMEGWALDDEKKRAYYRHIHDESQRLTRLIENVLRLAQLERDEWRAELSAHDPVEFVEALVRRLESQVKRAGFEIRVVSEGQPSRVSIDPDALTQIMINLIDNALKFAKDAENREVVVTVSQIGPDCHLRVRDFGPGVPRRELMRIFEKFYRVGGELTRTARGTGIGLALVKMLADSMGAGVDVRNCDPGAEFSLTLQASDSEAK